MYTVVFQEVKTVGVITSIWFNKMLRDPICILPWPDAGMHVTLHYLNVKAHVFDNHTVFRVKRRNNENVHQLITLSVFFRIKKKIIQILGAGQLSLTFSKNTLGRRITYK